MKKLSLAVTDLQVHSFETERVRDDGGTVYGAIVRTNPQSCKRPSEPWTCGIVCPETTDPQATGVCKCPAVTQAPAC